MINDFIKEIYLALKYVLKKPKRVLLNIANIGSSSAFAFALYALLMLYTNCNSPVVVVLSGSMEPGIYRGDMLLVSKPKIVNVGDIVVYKYNDGMIPIVHRVTSKHIDAEQTCKLLTKGDNNNADDRGLYPIGQYWLDCNDIMGSVYAIIPQLGAPTIWFNEYKIAKPLLILAMIIGLLLGKEIGIKREYSSEIGVFACLTNSYCLVGEGTNENFYSIFEAELSRNMPVVKTKIAGTEVVGSCCVGNKRGLLVPMSTTDQELMHIRNSLPDEIVIKRVHERLNALGNTISTNDYVALCHVDLDKETEEIIQDVLGVEVYRTTISNEVLVGQYSRFTNVGGIVNVSMPRIEIDTLSKLLEIPLAPGTVNCGSDQIAAGLLANDNYVFVGYDTTFSEIHVIEKVLKIGNN